ncbi:MAG: sporulation transcriptional regulator SpoIIID [Clostridiales bacterium]|nr:sporulation transcriptional regulator SpoIIID [Clostridiales bacterium]
MKSNVEKRCIEIGKYIKNSGATVRRAGTVFGISKSTVHIDVTKRLYEIDRELYYGVKKVLEENKAERHIRGGKATKEKYEKLKTADKS